MSDAASNSPLPIMIAREAVTMPPVNVLRLFSCKVFPVSDMSAITSAYPILGAASNAPFIATNVK